MPIFPLILQPRNVLQAELSKIANAAMHFICVCDDIFRDGMQYDAVTESYRRALAFVCRQLASEFDIVVEASSGTCEL